MAPVAISEVKNDARQNRTAAHSHIKGLGLKHDGTAERNAAGFVGQAGAREVREFSLSHLHLVLRILWIVCDGDWCLEIGRGRCVWD